MKKHLLLLFVMMAIKVNAQCYNNIYLGGGYTLALKDDGTLWATGSNNWSQLGIGTTSGTGVLSFTQINNDTNWQTISAGYNHTAAIKTDGSLWVWGSNQMGQLGLGSNATSVAVPTRVGNGFNWQTIVAGSYITVGIKTDGTLWTWGINHSGELGLGHYYGDENRPVQVGQDNDWQNVWAGNGRAIAQKTNGSVYVWGNNSAGQLGNGTTTNSNVPVLIEGNNWDNFYVGGSHTLALKNDGTLWGWGYNWDGQLGTGTTTNVTSPVQIGTDTWIMASAGENASAGIKSNGTAWTWGSYENYQLGTGAHTDALTPVQIGNENNWQFIGVSPSRHMFAMSNTSTYAWGSNGGALGNNDYSLQEFPIEVGCATMAAKTIKDADFVIYPNPALTGIYINHIAGFTIESVTITDLPGKIVAQKTGNTNYINVENLSSGIYSITVHAQGKTYRQKFVKR